MEIVNDISRLSFGCMRLPSKLEESERLIMQALDAGINYFDTAYVYPGNEELLGKIISRNNCRQRMLIATKLPHYLVRKPEDPERMFQTQLKRLQTDYIDYYLIHMLPDTAAWERMISLGVREWLEDKRASGQIRHIGFSYHGGTPKFKELIDCYPWEFTQVQYNYMDEHSQAGRAGVEYAAARNIPVIIMEPLRGGLLANRMPASARKLIEAHPDQRTAAEWSLRWLWDQPAVTSVLSGMTAPEMLEENIRICEHAPAGCVSEEDRAFFVTLKSAIEEKLKNRCTGCNYCMPCPFGVGIPTCFRCYNASYLDSYKTGIKEYVMNTSFSKEPSNAGQCRQCGKCVSHCPQSIDIPAELQLVKRRFEHPVYRVARALIHRFMHRNEREHECSQK